MNTNDPSGLSDDDPFSGLSAMVASARRVGARMIAYLVEGRARRLDLKAACSSLFDFCVRKLGMSEGEGLPKNYCGEVRETFSELAR